MAAPLPDDDDQELYEPQDLFGPEPEWEEIEFDDLDYMAQVAEDNNEDYYRELHGFGPI